MDTYTYILIHVLWSYVYLSHRSKAGVVNVYESQKAFATAPSSSLFAVGAALIPEKALMQLTTPISHLAFNHDNQMLSMSSRAAKDALRLVHLPTCTAFQNWPTSGTPLHYVQAAQFSPHSGSGSGYGSNVSACGDG